MRIYVSLLAAAMLASCSTKIAESLDSRPNAGPCPAVGSIYDASRYVSFAGPDKLYTNIDYTGEVVDVRMYCRYVGTEPLVAGIEVDFAFGKGPKGSSDTHTYPYFVAVTRRNGKVLAKESFAVDAKFKGGPVSAATEKFTRIEIPRVDESISGVNFEILVGFDLTDEQLEFNRAGKRFRLDAQQ